MFTIMRKTVDGRRSESYYQKRENAKRELLESVSRTVNHIGCTIIRTVDRFNEEKGFYEFQVEGTLSTGEKCTWALIDAYFED